MRRYLLMITGVLCGAGFAHAVWSSARAHDPYTTWRTHTGVSCCDKRDCRPAKAKWTPDGWQVRLRGQWCAIPARVVRPYPSPDGGPHVCASLTATGCQMYCFVHGEPKG